MESNNTSNKLDCEITRIVFEAEQILILLTDEDGSSDEDTMLKKLAVWDGQFTKIVHSNSQMLSQKQIETLLSCQKKVVEQAKLKLSDFGEQIKKMQTGKKAVSAYGKNQR